MANGTTRAVSPTRDALRILFRNPSAVLSLVMILLLASTAVTGTLFTGVQATPEQLESIQNAREQGDTLDLDVNTWSVQNPGKAELKDKLKGPFSRSEADDKTFFLGTDHLGRDVMAQLWAGSSISLTIGFLAVGISVLLGVSLGGIAGYFGRDRVRLPLLVSLLAALVGGIAYAVEAPRAGAVFLAISVVLLAFQAAVAVMGKRYRPVIVFAAALAIVAAVFAYNSYIENNTPEGKRLQHARKLADLSHDVLLLTRDLGHERRNRESGLPGARSEEWLAQKQTELEIAYRQLALAEHELNFNTWLTQIEIDERSAREQIARALHLRNSTDESLRELKDPQPHQVARMQRDANRLKAADELERAGNRGRSRAESVGRALPEITAAVESVIGESRGNVQLPKGFDFASAESTLNLLENSHVALLRVEHALAYAKAAGLLAASGAEVPKLESDPSKQLAAAAAFVKAAETNARQTAEIAAAVAGDSDEAKLKRENRDSIKADAAAAVTAAVAFEAAAKALGEVEKQSKELRAVLAKPADDPDRIKLFQYNYGIKDVAARNPLLPNNESSDTLLNRRAQMRADYLKKYESEAGSLFDGTTGIVKLRNLDGSLRYGTYRITRHFLAFTLLGMLLLVTALAMAGSAQAAAVEIGGTIGAIFMPTLTVDDLVMRFTEIMMTIPVIFLILAVLAMFERDVYIVMGVIGLTSWMGTTRFVRAEILSLREQDFVQAARALGVSDFRIIWRHLVPNAISPVLVSATIGVAGAVLAESTLSFLGIGAGADQHTWGKILSNGRQYIADAPWLTWIPGMAILITVLSFNLLGEGLREAFNPKLRGR